MMKGLIPLRQRIKRTDFNRSALFISLLIFILVMAGCGTIEEPEYVAVTGNPEVQIVDSDGDIVIIDEVTRAIVTIANEHHEIHEGDYYYVKGFADGTQTFLWVTPNTAEWAHAQWSLSAEGEFEFCMYEGVVTSNDGAPITIFNANRNSTNTATVQGFTGPTLNAGVLGDGLDGGIMVWCSKVGTGRQSTVGRSTGYEFIGRQNTKYWFQITQIAAGALWVDWDFNWYEHADLD